MKWIVGLCWCRASVAVRATLGVLPFLILSGCWRIPPIDPRSFLPKASFEGLQLTGLDLNGGSVNVILSVSNPNVFHLRVKRLGADVVLEGTHLGTTFLPEGFGLERMAQSQVTVPFSFTWGGVGAGVKGVLSRWWRGEPIVLAYQTQVSMVVDCNGKDLPVPPITLRGNWQP